jgi:hypothetical protein
MAPTTTQEIVDLTTKSARIGGAHIGDICFPRFRGATVKRDVLIAKAQAVGFPEKYIPEAMDQEAAWLYTMRSSHMGRQGFLVRPVSKTDGKIIFELVAEVCDKDGTARNEYRHISTLTLHRATGVAEYEVAMHAQVQILAMDYADAIGSVPTEKIRKMVCDTAAELNGVAVGTAWFVPAMHSETVQAMNQLIAGLGESELWLLPLYDSPESREGVNKAVRAGLEDKIREIRAEMESFTSDTRPSTMARRFETFTAIRDTAKLYADILEMTHEDLLLQVAELEGSLKQMICGA